MKRFITFFVFSGLMDRVLKLESVSHYILESSVSITHLYANWFPAAAMNQTKRESVVKCANNEVLCFIMRTTAQ